MASSEFQAEFISQLLLAESAEIATRAAQHLVDEYPLVAARYQPQAFLKWKFHFEGLVRELAAAAAVQTPAIFHRHVRWLREAFATRGVPSPDLEYGLRVAEGAILATVPREDHAWIAGVFSSFDPGAAPAEATHLGAGDDAARLATRLLVCALEGERLAACRLVVDAVRAGMSVRTAHEQVLCPAMREVGRLWHRGELSIAEEHACTSTIQTSLAQILAVATPAPRNGRSVLAAAVEGNSHDVGLRMVADAFELSGYRTVNLGSGVPPEDLAMAVNDFGADVVALSATLAIHLRSLADAIEATRAARPGNPPKIVAGGPGLSASPDLWKKVGADATAASAWESVAVVDRLLGLRE